jgi:pimeloyl-ACP methyl ester carboxylesterase
MLTRDAPLGANTLTVEVAAVSVWDRPGAGAPIILIHGNSASKEAFRPLIKSRALANRRVIAFDLLGCGDSADAANWQEVYTLPGLAQTVIDVVRAMALQDYTVVGWSMGGHIVIEALRFGLTPRGLVLTGTPPCGPSPEELASTFLPIEGSEVMGMENPSPEPMAAFVHNVYAPTIPSWALVRDARRADGRLRKRLFEHLYANPNSPPQRSKVAAWPNPIAVIQGDNEPFFDPAALKTLRWGNLWRGELQWIRGSGHAPFLDAPDDYAALLEEFAADI